MYKRQVEGADARLSELGIILFAGGESGQMDEPAFGSELGEALSSFDFFGDEPVAITTIQAPSNQLPKELIFIPALLLLAMIAWLQNARGLPAGRGEEA